MCVLLLIVSDLLTSWMEDTSCSHSIVSLNVPHVALTNLCICGWTEPYNDVKKVTFINNVNCILRHIRRPSWYN